MSVLQTWFVLTISIPLSKYWRAHPLIDLETIVELIGNTTTTTGLKIKTKIDSGTYMKGKKVSSEEFKTINITTANSHGEWNYTIHPKTKNV